jgi:hypothetical protein
MRRHPVVIVGFLRHIENAAAKRTSATLFCVELNRICRTIHVWTFGPLFVRGLVGAEEDKSDDVIKR